MIVTIFLIILLLRGLLIWQLGEAVINIKSPKLKGLAFFGLVVYVIYIAYCLVNSIPVVPENIARLIAIISVLVAVNKELKCR